MAVERILKEKFNSYNHYKSPLASLFGIERSWFADDENNLIGIVLEDRIDKDWAFVVLALHEDGLYRAISVNSSLESMEIAEDKLLENINVVGRAGKAQEELFNKPKSNEESEQIVITNINDEIKKYFKEHPEKLYNLTPRKFEELIASIMEDFGFTVELTQATRDGGRDIIAYIKNAVTEFLAYIECKKYSADNKVGVGIIREVIGVHYIRKPSKSIIVTTSFFTPDAIKEANIIEHQLGLRDYNNIKEWLSKY